MMVTIAFGIVLRINVTEVATAVSNLKTFIWGGMYSKILLIRKVKKKYRERHENMRECNLNYYNCYNIIWN